MLWLETCFLVGTTRKHSFLMSPRTLGFLIGVFVRHFEGRRVFAPMAKCWQVLVVRAWNYVSAAKSLLFLRVCVSFFFFLGLTLLKSTRHLVAVAPIIRDRHCLDMYSEHVLDTVYACVGVRRELSSGRTENECCFSVRQRLRSNHTLCDREMATASLT